MNHSLAWPRLASAILSVVLLSGVTTVAFGLVMGLPQGWPLVLLASVSAVLKMITRWPFRWVRLSPRAQARRETAGAH